MRNLKRALSLALASVMLLGMMVVGTSAASINDFTDVDEINNKEAVAIATGLGIFDGYDDGSFGPEKVVNRAEMAVVIAKILHGADVNPAIFAGDSKFTDVPAWAEGYVNLAAGLNIIVGRGEGIFDPYAPVTTVEASTMLLKALGYYVDEEDALGSDWKLEVAHKANALGIYGDLALAMDAGLTRENVAELAFNTLFAQRVAFDDVRGLHVKTNDRNVVVTTGTEDETNTLAYNVFGLLSETGVVVNNAAVDPDLAATDSTEAITTVELADGTQFDYEYESGIDLIGHEVEVYYTIENKDVVVYTMVDKAVVTGVITYNTNYSTMNAEAVKAGFKTKSISDDVNTYFVNYDLDATVETVELAVENGDYLVLVSNSANKAVDYVIVLNQYLDVIAVTEDSEEELVYEIETYNDDIYMMDELTDGQYVIVTPTNFTGADADYAVVEAAVVDEAKITKITGKSTGTASDYKTVTADGEKYTKSPVATDAFTADDITVFMDIADLGDATMILDTFGKLIALDEEPETDIGYVYVAQFGYKYGTISSLKDKIVLSAHVYYADGTNGIVTVDVEDSDPAIAAALKGEGSIVDIEANYKDLNVVTEDNDGEFVGVYYLKEQTDGTVILMNVADLSTETEAEDQPAAQADAEEITYSYTDENGVIGETDRIVKNHNTILRGVDSVKTAGDAVMYQNKNTVYFYVDGNYEDEDFTVEASIGIANQDNFDMVPAWIEELWVCTPSTGKATVEAMIVHGLVESSSLGICYYNEGNWDIDAIDGGYALTFTAYNANGEEVTFTYEYEKYSEARAAANGGLLAVDGEYVTEDGTEVIPSGYYKFYTDKLITVENVVNNDDENWNGDVKYVANDDVTGTEFDKYEYNLFTALTDEGFIYSDAKVIDLATGKYNSVNRLYKAITEGTIIDVVVSYSFDDDDYNCKVLYVIDYTVVAEAEAGSTATDYTFAADLKAINEDGAMAIEGTVVDKTGAELTAATVKKVAYTVKTTLANGNTLTKTYASAGEAAIDGVFTDTVGGLTVSANGTVVYEVTIMATIEVEGKTYTLGGNVDLF